MVALAHGRFAEALPTLQIWEMLLQRDVVVVIMEDTSATITVPKAGYSEKLRHLTRHQRVNVGSVKE